MSRAVSNGMTTPKHYTLLALTLLGAAALDVWRYRAIRPLLEFEPAPAATLPATEPAPPPSAPPAPGSPFTRSASRLP